MQELFEQASLIPGLRVQPDFITGDEESELIARIEAADLIHFDFNSGQASGW